MGVLIAYSSSAHRNLDLLPSREVPDRTGWPCRTSSAAPTGTTGGSGMTGSCDDRCSLRGCRPLDIPAQFRVVGRHRAFEGPGERPAADRQVKTGDGRMQISTPTGQRTAMIGHARVPGHHHTQQTVLGRALPAADAGSLRACWGQRPTRHPLVYLPAPTSLLRVRQRTVVRFISAHSRSAAGPSPARSGPGKAPDSPVVPARPADRHPPGPAVQPCGCCSVSGRMSIRQPVSRAASRAFWPSLPIASESW
jgi:hypothetical protein